MDSCFDSKSLDFRLDFNTYSLLTPIAYLNDTIYLLQPNGDLYYGKARKNEFTNVSIAVSATESYDFSVRSQSFTQIDDILYIVPYTNITINGSTYYQLLKLDLTSKSLIDKNSYDYIIPTVPCGGPPALCNNGTHIISGQCDFFATYNIEENT